MYILKQDNIGRLYLSLVLIHATLIPFVHILNRGSMKYEHVSLNTNMFSSNTNMFSSNTNMFSSNTNMYSIRTPSIHDSEYILFILIVILPFLNIFFLTTYSTKYVYLMKFFLNITPSNNPPFIVFPFQSLANALGGLLIYILLFNSVNYYLMTIYICMLPSMIMGVHSLSINLYNYIAI